MLKRLLIYNKRHQKQSEMREHKAAEKRKQGAAQGPSHTTYIRVVRDLDASSGHRSKDEHDGSVVGYFGADEVGGVVELALVRHAEAARARGQVARDRTLDNLEKHVGAVGGADLEAVQQLYHQAGEALEGTGDTTLRVHLDQHVLLGVDVHFDLASLVQGAVQHGHQLLVHDVGAVLSWVLVVLLHDIDVVVAIKQLKVSLFGLDGLQRGLVKDNNNLATSRSSIQCRGKASRFGVRGGSSSGRRGRGGG
jgi:hypothetical protein